MRETTKSRRVRVVTVDEGTAVALRQWKAQEAEERLAFGPAYRGEGWVVAEADGSLVQPDTLSSRWKRLERLADVRPIRLHGARHTHATLALAAGARLDVISRQLGHASISISADVYGHRTTMRLTRLRDWRTRSGRKERLMHEHTWQLHGDTTWGNGWGNH